MIQAIISVAAKHIMIEKHVGLEEIIKTEKCKNYYIKQRADRPRCSNPPEHHQN